MNDDHVQIAEAHLGEGCVDGGRRRVVGLVLRRDLGRHENFFPGHAAAADPLAHTPLIAVGLGRVDVAVTDGRGGFHRVGHGRVVDQPGAQGEPGNRHAVV